MSGFITIDGAQHMLAVLSGIEERLEAFHIALVHTPVGLSESGNEIDEIIADGYTRGLVYTGEENWFIAHNVLTSLVEVYFPVPSTPWTNINGYAVCDSNYGGRVLFAGSFSPTDIDPSEQFFIPAGGISIDLELQGWMRSQ